MSINFSGLELAPEEVTNESKQAEVDAIIAENTKQLRIALSKVANVKVLAPPRVSRLAKSDVTQLEYSCRLYALCNIIRNPSLSTMHNALHNSWTSLYPDIPYHSKATNWPLGKKDKATLTELLKAEGLYKRRAMKTVADVIDMVKVVHQGAVIIEQVKTINEQNKLLQHYKFVIDEKSDSIIYKGHFLKYSARHRGYCIKIGNKDCIVPKSGLGKLRDIFNALDLLS